jgi:hypothetical protein
MRGAVRLPRGSRFDISLITGPTSRPGERAAAAFSAYADLRAKGDHVEAMPGYTVPIAAISATITEDGSFTVTNSRNGFTKTSRASGSAAPR